MPYKFTFDLSQISKNFFKEVAALSKRKAVHKKIGHYARLLAKKFKVSEYIGLPICDTITIIEDLLDVHIRNLAAKERFNGTKKRALLLPHCARAHMDARCRATFNKKLSSYKCAHCTSECQISRATKLGEKYGYEVYVLPGGSCVRKIIKHGRYDGVVGVACCEELKLGGDYLDALKIPAIGLPLIKNGCSGTKFSIRELKAILSTTPSGMMS